MSGITKKRSFADTMENTQAVLHNSNLENLANALMATQAHIQEYQKLEATIKALAAKIEEGTLVDVSEVFALNRMAHGQININL